MVPSALVTQPAENQQREGDILMRSLRHRPSLFTTTQTKNLPQQRESWTGLDLHVGTLRGVSGLDGEARGAVDQWIAIVDVIVRSLRRDNSSRAFVWYGLFERRSIEESQKMNE